MMTNETIIGSISIIYLVVLFISILAVMMYYSNYLSAINDNEFKFGYWYGTRYRLKGDCFYFIDNDIEDEFIQNIIKQHRKAVKFYWIWFLMLIPMIIIFNLID